MATYNIKSNSSDIVLNNNDIMNVLAGGWADNTTVNTGATMNVSSGGKAWLTVLDGGRMIVSSGGSSWEADVNANALFIVTGKPKCVEYTRVNSRGSMIVSSNGQADYTIIKNGGKMVVSTYGSAFSTTVSAGGTMTIMNNAKGSGVSIGGQLTVSSGGSASNTQVYGNGRADVSGGWLNNTVSSGGMVYVFSGGSASNTKLSDNGKLIILENGSAHTNKISSGGKMYISSGGSATSNTVLSGGTMVISQGGSMGYGNTVSSGGSVVLYGSAGEILTQKGGTVSIKSGAIVTNLTNKGGEIVLEKGVLIRSYKGDPLKLPDCDDGWNNYVYDKKADAMNPKSLNVIPLTKIPDSTKKISLDKDGSVSVDGRVNFVGYGDEADYAKFTLTKAASLSFLLNATGAVKFTIWSLTTGKNGTKSMKSLQATSAKKDKSTGDYLATTKDLLLDTGDYYISVESTDAKKGGNAYYNVMLNKGDCVFYNRGDDFDDDWGPFKADDYHGVAHLGTVDGKKETLIEDGWVGYGDAVDYRKFTLKTGAKLSLAVYSTDATKISVCRVDSKPGKEPGLTFYTLKTLQTTTLKKEKMTDDYFSLTKSLLLEKGDYFIRVESTNAKKGGNAEYSVNLADVGYETVFFNKGNNSDDWDDMKTKGAAGKVLTFGEIKANTTSIMNDEWVGYGDEIDYRKFTLGSDAKLSFEVFATDAAKFIVYRLVSKTDKKGITTYSLKALQTTTVKAHDMKTTKLLALDADTYYFSMASTNAKKGGNATYDINLSEFVANPKSTKVASALTMSEPEMDLGFTADDAVASALAMPESEPALGFAETCAGSATGLLASL
jgi:autotransporter passenger strand-loop-strand repeat protein